jgi:hypothetical protein
MIRRPALLNRAVLAAVGLLLFAIGAAALVRGLGLYPQVFGTPHAEVLDRSARAFAGRNAWFWTALAALLFVLAVAALYWLAAQVPGRIRLLCWDDARDGRDVLRTSALAEALDRDLSASPELRRTSVAFVGTSARPRLRLSVTADPHADPALVREGIVRALNRLRRSLEPDRLPTTVRIRTGR